MCLTFHASLKHVSLAGNMLSSTTGLEQLVNLEVLDLSSNRITRIGENMFLLFLLHKVSSQKACVFRPLTTLTKSPWNALLFKCYFEKINCFQ